jgi:hypothetical protein
MTRHIYTAPQVPPETLEEQLLALTAAHDAAAEAMDLAEANDIDLCTPASDRAFDEATKAWIAARDALLAAKPDTITGFAFQARVLLGTGEKEADVFYHGLMTFAGVHPFDEAVR